MIYIDQTNLTLELLIAKIKSNIETLGVTVMAWQNDVCKKEIVAILKVANDIIPVTINYELSGLGYLLKCKILAFVTPDPKSLTLILNNKQFPRVIHLSLCEIVVNVFVRSICVS
jgi:hypothetical protein